MAEDARERRDDEAVQREGHRRGAAHEVRGGEEPVRPFGDLQLDERLEGEAGDDRRLRRQVGVPLHVEVELLLAQLERILLDAGQQHLLVGLEHAFAFVVCKRLCRNLE
jgi:hypothetical protein